jgi:hypothetical protein
MDFLDPCSMFYCQTVLPKVLNEKSKKNSGSEPRDMSGLTGIWLKSANGLSNSHSPQKSFLSKR